MDALRAEDRRLPFAQNDPHDCQRTTASGDCRLRPAGAERSWFGNGISRWAVRLYASNRTRGTKSITASLGSRMSIENKEQSRLLASSSESEKSPFFTVWPRIIS